MTNAHRLSTKARAELRYWTERFINEDQKLRNGWYEQLMLNISGMQHSDLEGKIVADFGSGPRGSLEWCDHCGKRICIDVLASEYMQVGIGDHKAVYVQSTESYIPLPSNYVDILFTVNSLDHVEELEIIANELLRIIKPGGILCASLNLNEPSSPAEPQTITEDWVLAQLACNHGVERYKVAPKVPDDIYQHLNEWAIGRGEPPPLPSGEIGVLWCVIRK